MKLNKSTLIIIILLAAIAIVLQVIFSKPDKDTKPEPEPIQTAETSPPVSESDWELSAAALSTVKEQVLSAITQGEESGYSHYYAGGYVDENVKLVIMLTEDSEEIRDYYMDLADIENISFKPAKYPYSILLETLDFINSCNQDAGIEAGLISAGIDEQNNLVIVYLSDLSEEKLNLFRENIANSECISFDSHPVFSASN